MHTSTMKSSVVNNHSNIPRLRGFVATVPTPSIRRELIFLPAAEARRKFQTPLHTSPYQANVNHKTQASTAGAAETSKKMPHAVKQRAVIIGAGPSGLCTAIMLARRGYTDIQVYERMPEPPAPDDKTWTDFETSSDRLYMIGLNSRGQDTLNKLDILGRLEHFTSKVAGRLDWRPESPVHEPKETLFAGTRKYLTKCIQRDRLAACLLQEVRERYSGAVRVEFGVDCVHTEWGEPTGVAGPPQVCKITLERQALLSGSRQHPATHSDNASGPQGRSSPTTWVEECPFVVGADGSGSEVRNSMEKESRDGFKVHRYQDKNVLVYRTIPLYSQDGQPLHGKDPWRKDLNYSARSKSGVSLDALPTPEGPHIGVVLYRPGDKALAQVDAGGPPAARSFFEKEFPMFEPMIREADVARFAAKRDSSLPRFSYAGPVLHHGGTTCLVGDVCHTVKPYFGQGVNSAFEDVQVLERALEETQDDIPRAVHRYSELRASDAEALVHLSHSLDGNFFTFVGPLILDSILHKMLPNIFSPNIIASLQNEKWRFSEVRARKRIDRALQVLLLASVTACLVKLILTLVAWVGRILLKA